MTRISRIVFVAAMLLSFVMATLPQPPALPGDPSDKLIHILAFAVLGILCSAGFPDRSIAKLFIGLTCLGALIELVQAIPVLNRDSDLADLVADMAAAYVGLISARWMIERYRVGNSTEPQS